MGKTLSSQCRGPRFDPLVGELDPACMLQLRVCMLQLKIPPAAIKTRRSQNKERKKKEILTVNGSINNSCSVLGLVLGIQELKMDDD